MKIKSQDELEGLLSKYPLENHSIIIGRGEPINFASAGGTGDIQLYKGGNYIVKQEDNGIVLEHKDDYSNWLYQYDSSGIELICIWKMVSSTKDELCDKMPVWINGLSVMGTDLIERNLKEFYEKLYRFSYELEQNFSLVNFAGTLDSAKLDLLDSNENRALGSFVYKFGTEGLLAFLRRLVDKDPQAFSLINIVYQAEKLNIIGNQAQNEIIGKLNKISKELKKELSINDQIFHTNSNFYFGKRVKASIKRYSDGSSESTIVYKIPTMRYVVDIGKELSLIAEEIYKELGLGLSPSKFQGINYIFLHPNN